MSHTHTHTHAHTHENIPVFFTAVWELCTPLLLAEAAAPTVVDNNLAYCTKWPSSSEGPLSHVRSHIPIILMNLVSMLQKVVWLKPDQPGQFCCHWFIPTFFNLILVFLFVDFLKAFGHFNDWVATTSINPLILTSSQICVSSIPLQTPRFKATGKPERGCYSTERTVSSRVLLRTASVLHMRPI